MISDHELRTLVPERSSVLFTHLTITMFEFIRFINDLQ